MQQEALRIYENIDFLLAESILPGKFAEAVLEARQTIQAVIAKLKEKTSEQQEQQHQAGNSVGDAQDTGGLVDGGVPDSGR